MLMLHITTAIPCGGGSGGAGLNWIRRTGRVVDKVSRGNNIRCEHTRRPHCLVYPFIAFGHTIARLACQAGCHSHSLTPMTWHDTTRHGKTSMHI